MPFSGLSNWNLENNQTYRSVRVWANICRFLLAVVFVFSGFVKAVDPLGTQYKLQDYLIAFGWSDLFPDALLFLASVLLGCVEFCLGMYLFFGIRRRLAPRLVLLMMSIMTPLTLWLALDNPVSDCGCFGDAVVLSNWETFWKNVLLLAASISIFKWRKCIFPLVTTRFDWLIALYSWVYIIVVISWSVWYLPLFDFRPYHIGANIPQGMVVPEGKEPTSYETYFIMEKDGVQKEFVLDDYPDSTWTFVDTRMEVKKRGYEPPIPEFRVYSSRDDEDITDAVLASENYTFLLVGHHLNVADESSLDLINELYDYCIEHGYGFYCLTASSDVDIMKWQERTGAEYPFGIVDDVILKTMIRSNPGLMLLKGGTVLNKWSANDLPDEYQLTDRLENLPLGQPGGQSVGRKLLTVFGYFCFPLLLVCMIDRLWELRSRRRRLKKTEN